MKWIFFIIFFYISKNSIAQPGYTWTDGRLSIFHWKLIDRSDYMLQCPRDWQIDSNAAELKMSIKQTDEDSLVFYVYSFKSNVIPFKSFIKDPPVDFNAKTTIIQDSDPMVYIVTSTQHCTTCKIPTIQKREQRYSVKNNKIYILYFIGTDNAYELYKKNLATISNSFIIKE